VSRLRVLHLGKYYAPVRGGIETVLELLCRGEQVSVESRALVINTAPARVDEAVGPVRVTRAGRLLTVGAVSLSPSLPVCLAEAGAEADLIVLHEPNPMALVAYAIARPRAPLVVWYHSEVIRPRWQYELFYQPVLSFALRRASAIVVASPPMADVPALEGYREKCVVIPFGLDLEQYRCSPVVAARATEMREQAVGLSTLLFVGRLVGYKGVDVLLRALPGLAARAVVVGDGPLRGALEGLARELGVADRVRFAGQASDADLLAWYHACDAFVLPSTSRQEAFGMVQLEAMLCGKPVVSTDLGTGVAWVNQHERTGLVVPPGDVTALRRALAALVGDADLRRRLGEQARARVLERFTAETMCRATVALYQDVAARSARPVAAEEARVH
jgi:glycosyltransferase involved in cell wall biosynthesis